MDRKRKLAIVFATVAVAAGSGHLMQSGRGAEAAVAALAVAPVAPRQAATPAVPATAPPAALAEVAVPAAVPAVEATVAAIHDAVPDAPPAIAAKAALPALAALVGPAVAATPALPDILPLPPARAAGPRDCTPRLTLLPAPGAMVDLILAAPCDAGARVVVRHEALAVTGRTGPDGSLVLALPALAAEARVAVALPGGATAEAVIAVPALAAWDRVGVQWQAPDLFQLNAFAGGADYGAPGHIHAGAPQAAAGFLTLLGDDTVERPMLAEVLSVPRGALADGTLRVTVEAPVTAGSCGRDLLAELFEFREGKPAASAELILAAPECSAAGDWLVMPWDPGPGRLAAR